MSQDPTRLIDEVVSVGDLERMHKNKRYHDLNHYRLNGRELVMALLATTKTPGGDYRGDPNTSLIFSAGQRILWQEGEIARLTKEVELRSTDAWREKEPKLTEQNNDAQINRSWVSWFMKKYQENVPGAMREASARYAKEVLNFEQNATNQILIDAVTYTVYLIKLRNEPWKEIKDQPGMYANQVDDEWLEEFCRVRAVEWSDAVIIGANAILDRMITGDDRKYEISIHFSSAQKDLFHFQILRHYYEGAPFSEVVYIRNDEQERLRK